MTGAFRNMNSSKLKQKIAQLTDAPGVYIFKDERGRILYVGKAKSLKKRVQSYFSRPLDTKSQILVSKICDLEYINSASESQAQILEAAMIKDRQPPYNISLKDDKSFPWIKITAEEFPAVSICRRKLRKKSDRAVYFGPYTNVKLLRQAFKIIRRIFGFRSCKKLSKAPCLYFRLKLCPGPCAGKISAKQYQEIIRQIKMFLESRYPELLHRLSQQMQAVAQKQDFETAAQIRDQINALSTITNGQVSHSSVGELEDLKRLLSLSRMPNRIEAFDISNIFGHESCGSMVTFSKGIADKNNYRRFRIKTVKGIDDYAMLREVLARRYTRVKIERLPLPDLVLIDGGRAHLLVAKKVIKNLGLNLPLMSIAKDRENIYVLNRAHPISLNADTPALNLIRRVRDEAHRFALAYHHILRRKQAIGR